MLAMYIVNKEGLVYLLQIIIVGSIGLLTIVAKGPRVAHLKMTVYKGKGTHSPPPPKKKVQLWILIDQSFH